MGLLYRAPSHPPLPSRCTLIVTGASTGIGADVAEALARLHSEWLVLAGVRRASDGAATLAKGLPNLRPLSIDVAVPGGAAAGVAEALRIAAAENSPICALVNNAGIMRESTIEFAALDEARSIFDVNVFGALETTQLLLPQLAASHGRVVFVSSVAGEISTPRGGIYAASKFALEAIADALRREVSMSPSSRHVAVSVVQPAYVKSAIAATALAARNDPTNVQRIASAQAIYPSLYSDARSRKTVTEVARASSPGDTTTPTIISALTDTRPLQRYQTAFAGHMHASLIVVLKHLLPTRLIDALLTSD